MIDFINIPLEVCMPIISYTEINNKNCYFCLVFILYYLFKSLYGKVYVCVYSVFLFLPKVYMELEGRIIVI